MADDGGRLRSYGTPPAASPPAGQQPYPPPHLGQCSPAHPPLQGLQSSFCDDRRPQNLYFTQPYCQQPPPGFLPLPNGHQNCRALAGGQHLVNVPQLRANIVARERSGAAAIRVILSALAVPQLGICWFRVPEIIQ
ncbi:hypothetical protein CDV36_016226 [Fusarium kuroshium]|uniref:Uncharacterized protein n=1 Tax=Fusarium kuroshium TaxID=2010991 RepID=A0A3M2QWV3_9HYPO|nr:hypothetical protein CDV36_016226 [Fusarium kuroshium]